MKEYTGNPVLTVVDAMVVRSRCPPPGRLLPARAGMIPLPRTRPTSLRAGARPGHGALDGRRPSVIRTCRGGSAHLEGDVVHDVRGLEGLVLDAVELQGDRLSGKRGDIVGFQRVSGVRVQVRQRRQGSATD